MIRKTWRHKKNGLKIYVNETDYLKTARERIKELEIEKRREIKKSRTSITAWFNFVRQIHNERQHKKNIYHNDKEHGDIRDRKLNPRLNPIGLPSLNSIELVYFL